MYRKKHDALRIKLVDGTLKTILADTSLPISGLVAVIGKKIGIKNPEEYSLQFENGSNY